LTIQLFNQEEPICQQ